MANSGAHSVRGGFNQSGGAYFIVIADIAGKLFGYTPGKFSGGATEPGTVTSVAANVVFPTGNPANYLGVGKLIKDMGKTVVVPLAGSNPVVNVTYRKFQVVQAPSAPNANGQQGIVPAPNGTPQMLGYGSFYLEVGRDGQQNSSPAAIARYF